MASRGPVVMAGLAALACVMASVSFVRTATDDLLIRATLKKVVTLPAAALPAGARQPFSGTPATQADRAALSRALRRDPLDQGLANASYVDLVDRATSRPAIRRATALLGRLGWRDTATQENLMVENGLSGDIAAVIDRADAMLRRRKALAPVNQMLGALEASSVSHKRVVQRLRTMPGWRPDYLVATAQAAPPAFLTARAVTLRQLADAGSPVQRRELAPVLSGLLVAGQGPAAVELWRHIARRPPAAGNLLADPRFAEAQARSPEATTLPFDWTLGSDPGAQAAPAQSGPGVDLNWDGRGLPTFLSQWVAVDPGRRLRFIVAGQANGAALRDILRPTLVCGNKAVSFDAVGGDADHVVYRSDPVVTGCQVGRLDLGAQLRDQVIPTTATLTGARLDENG